MKKLLFLTLLPVFLFFSCLNKKMENVKCVVVSCNKIVPISIHDDINRPLGYKLETSCGKTFKSKIRYKKGDTIEVIKITYIN